MSATTEKRARPKCGLCPKLTRRGYVPQEIVGGQVVTYHVRCCERVLVSRGIR